MDGLTAKVFWTYNASVTLQGQLRALTRGEQVPSLGLVPGCLVGRRMYHGQCLGAEWGLPGPKGTVQV